jgi:hypothetical protein
MKGTVLTGLIGVIASTRLLAADVSSLFSNPGFESGNLSGWTVTQPNTNNYVSSLSPPVNPSIDPADPGNNPTLLTAPSGSFFTGLMEIGTPANDPAYKLSHDALSISVSSGTTFQVTLWANRGRLEPFDAPSPSPPTATVKIFGWTSSGAAPTVTASTDNWSRSISWNPAALSFDFTLVPDGTWAAQTFTFDPAASGIDAANLKYLSFSISGLNHNHDEYIALDVAPVPEPSTFALAAAGLAIWLRSCSLRQKRG